MKTILLLGYIALVFCPLVGDGSEPHSVASSLGKFVPANDSNFSYEGRFDFRDPAKPVIIWQASRVSIAWTGDDLSIEFDSIKGQNFFDATVDGETSVVSLVEGRPPKGTHFSNLGHRRHRLTLFKRSEAAAGTAAFRGIRIGSNEKPNRAEVLDHRVKMEFFGDSITAGACDEDGPADQWEDRSTHNNAKSYGAFTAAAFSADYRNIAISGMGVVTGYVKIVAPDFWDRLYPEKTSPRADLKSWVPDVIFVNLGENDDSHSTLLKQPFPFDKFVSDYVAMIGRMRRIYPHSQIVLLRGGMFGGSQSETLRHAWDQVVERLEARDHAIVHFVFTHWTLTHPRVADHRILADELIAWLRRQSFMKRYPWSEASVTP